MFPLGRLLATPGILALDLDVMQYVNRHLFGDWGDLDPEDARANHEALKNGLRVFSSYETPLGRIWVISEADRSATTVLLPDEY